MNVNYMFDAQSESQLLSFCASALSKPVQPWTLRLLPRTYTLSQTVELPDSCTVLGNGSTFYTSAPVALIAGKNSVVTDLALRGTTNSGVGMAMRLNGSRSSFSNLKISGFGRGMLFNSNWCISVNDCFFGSCNTCVELINKYVFNLTIRGGALEACTTGLRLVNGIHGTILLDGVCIEGCKEVGVALLGYVYNVGITHCHFEANPHDVLINGDVKNVLLQHNLHFRHTNTAILATIGKHCTLMDSMFVSSQEPYTVGKTFQAFNVGRLVSTNAGEVEGATPLPEPQPVNSPSP